MNNFTKTRHVSPKDKVKHQLIVDLLTYQIEPRMLNREQITKYFRIGSSFLTTGMISPKQLDLLKLYASITEEDLCNESVLDIVGDDLDNESVVVQDYIESLKFKTNDNRDI